MLYKRLRKFKNSARQLGCFVVGAVESLDLKLDTCKSISQFSLFAGENIFADLVGHREPESDDQDRVRGRGSEGGLSRCTEQAIVDMVLRSGPCLFRFAFSGDGLSAVPALRESTPGVRPSNEEHGTNLRQLVQRRYSRPARRKHPQPHLRWNGVIHRFTGMRGDLQGNQLRRWDE